MFEKISQYKKVETVAVYGIDDKLMFTMKEDSGIEHTLEVSYDVFNKYKEGHRVKIGQ